MCLDVVDLEKEIAPIIGSRDVLECLEERIKKAEYIILDFKNVKFISRSAAHKLLNYKNNHPEKIEFINMNDSVKKMLEIVEAQINGHVNKDKFKPSKIRVIELTV